MRTKLDIYVLFNTTFKAFQYKVSLRCLYPCERLRKCKLLGTEMCTFCFETKEAMTQFPFYYWTHVRLLRLQFVQC